MANDKLTKKCSCCKATKPITEFGKDRKCKDGYRYSCYECFREYNKKFYHKNTKKAMSRNRKSNYKRLYKIPVHEYDKMLEKQNDGCAICGELNLDGRRLAVDHNHNTGKIRGLLCQRCNGFIVGIIEKYPELIQKSVEYLKKH